MKLSERMQSLGARAWTYPADWADEVEQLEAENERLNKTIRDTVREMGRHAPDPMPFNQPLWQRLNIIRCDALKEGE